MTTHHLDDSVIQPFWDNSVEPRLRIEPGDTVVFDCRDATGQLDADCTIEDYNRIDRNLIHALNGSVYVEGAEPGDALQVDILDMQHKGWGWTAHRPEFGLLSDECRGLYFHKWRIDDDGCHFGVADIVVPFSPMAGCVGVAPKEPGRLDTIPPRANAGNVDVRDLTIGTTFWLPVFVPGALFATGDCHAAQGQGEVCGTGIECPMTVTMKFGIRRDLAVTELQYVRGSRAWRADEHGYHGTTAHGPDLHENARNAVRYMIDWLIANQGLTWEEAYSLCSVACDLQISEVVDAPNWIVSAHMPLGIFKN